MLTSNEQMFLQCFVRMDEEMERVAAYRECKCVGHEKSDMAVKRAITKLVAREDAKQKMHMERVRRDILNRAERMKADGMSVEAEISTMQKREMVMDVALHRIFEEDVNLDEDKKRAVTGIAKLIGEFDKLTKGETAEAGLSAEEAAELEDKRQAEEAKPAAKPVLLPQAKEGEMLLPGRPGGVA